MKIAYLHTAGYHPIHGAYARAAGADFIRIDKYLPCYHDRKQNKIKQYISMLINSFFSPVRRYDVIITDEVKPEAAIIKLTSFRKKKLIATQASYTLTKVYEKKLPTFNIFLLKKIVNYYDALICVGDELYTIAREVCKKNTSIEITKIYNGVNDERIQLLSGNEYDASSDTIVSIANCFSRDTYNYKGVDVMIAVFDKLVEEYPRLKFIIVGNFIKEVNDEILLKYSERTRQRITFHPFDHNILKYLAKALLYLQLSRYESFGIAVTEAAFAGIPSFVSNQVGSRVMFNKLVQGSDFIIENENIDEGVKKISAFINLPDHVKSGISNQFRRMVQPYSEKNAVQNYKQIFNSVVKDGINL